MRAIPIGNLDKTLSQSTCLLAWSVTLSGRAVVIVTSLVSCDVRYYCEAVVAGDEYTDLMPRPKNTD